MFFYPFFSFLFFYYTNVYFKSTQHVETAMAATAEESRDMARLEPLVFFFLFSLFITLMFIFY
jgi:hypothetical protein